MAVEKIQIHTKARKRFGIVYPAQPTNVMAEIERNKSIRMVGFYNNNQVDITFNMGDMAEYDSYNLSYYGEIVGISTKSVQIKEKHGGRIHRLDLNTFMWRNHDFDLEKTIAKNHEERHYI